MRQAIAVLAGVIVAGWAFSAQAGPACCPAGKAEKIKQEAAAAGCGGVVGQCAVLKKHAGELQLSAEQKAELGKVHAKCGREGGKKGKEAVCGEACAKTTMERMGKILNADQLAKLKAICDREGCPLKEKDAETKETI